MRILRLSLACFLTLCYATYDFYRLPRAIEPNHYDLRILTHLEDDTHLFFTGDVKIHFTTLHETDNITLHVGKELNIAPNDTWLRSSTYKCNEPILISRIERVPKYDFYIVHLESVLTAVHRYVLHLHFWSRLSRGLSGYYVSSYPDDDEPCRPRYISLTQFEPTSARSGFPCFDEPDMKASFNITLGHMSNYSALSNMPLLNIKPMCGHEDWVWSTFRQSEVMSTYLVAYSINDFEGYSSYCEPHSGIHITTWARPAMINLCQFAAEISPDIIFYYEKLFNIRYSLSKIDQLAVPDFSAGAMENWGLIIYRENSLFYSEEDSSISDMQHVTTTVAHELAHQWFGNLVTMKWWDDLWLNEGFATYIATLGIDSLCADWSAYEEQSIEYMLYILNADAYCNTHPIHQTVSEPSEIAELFDTITYRKGAVLIRMVHIFIGDTAFRCGIHNYLTNFAYSNAKQEDLWLALSKAAHDVKSIPPDLDVGTIMDTWTLQKGVPLINVERHYQIKSATVSQSRFIQHNDAVSFPFYQPLETEIWYVPISYTIESQADFISIEPIAWMRGDILKSNSLALNNLPDDDEWLILNIQLGTPYRVNYDPFNWDLIIKGLSCDSYRRIHVINRAQLVDDVMALAWSGHVSYCITFKLLDYLKYESEYLPWRAALDQFTIIERVIRETCDFEDFQHYMHHLLEPIYCRLEGMDEDTEVRHHATHKTLINKWACRMRQEDCVKKALDYFHHWLISSDPDNENPVPKNLRSVVYCTAMQHGDEEDWEFLWQRYRNTTTASTKQLILLSLGCISDVTLLEKYLKLIFCSDFAITKQDAAQIFTSIVHNDPKIAKEFFMNNFDVLQDFFEFERRTLGGIIAQVANHLSSIQDYREMKILLNDHREVLKASERCVRRALEQTHLNLNWRRMKLSEFTNTMSLRYCD